MQWADPNQDARVCHLSESDDFPYNKMYITMGRSPHSQLAVFEFTAGEQTAQYSGSVAPPHTITCIPQHRDLFPSWARDRQLVTLTELLDSLIFTSPSHVK